MRALITGITGQDGSYLAELLLDKGYEVYGLCQPGTGAGCLSARPSESRIHWIEGDLKDYQALCRAFQMAQPRECYHLAAQTFVPDEEFSTYATNANGTHHVLAALNSNSPDCRFFYAGSSEMFGDVDTCPQVEDTPFRPRTMYGVSKVAGYSLVRYYRRTQGIFACSGILYNHESPRRPPHFVTRKITRAAARIRHGLERELRLGNLDAVRDWGDARDYVEAMWCMLQHDTPDDYVVATGIGRTVKDLLEAAFSAVGLNWRDYVICDPKFYRPAEPVPLIGSPAKARSQLGWEPKRCFETTVRDMVQEDIETINVA